MTGRHVVYGVAAIWVGYSIVRIVVLDRPLVANLVGMILGLVVLWLLLRRSERARSSRDPRAPRSGRRAGRGRRG